eukprot:4732614-Prymnesium_polylepis.1
MRVGAVSRHPSGLMESSSAKPRQPRKKRASPSGGGYWGAQLPTSPPPTGFIEGKLDVFGLGAAPRVQSYQQTTTPFALDPNLSLAEPPQPPPPEKLLPSVLLHNCAPQPSRLAHLRTVALPFSCAECAHECASAYGHNGSCSGWHGHGRVRRVQRYSSQVVSGS